jgi:hypothetical protein
MKDFDWARAARDDAPFGKANPLTGILPQQGVTLCPIFGFVLLPIRVDPLGNLRRQTFDQASHGLSRSAHVTIIHRLSLKSKAEKQEIGEPKMKGGRKPVPTFRNSSFKAAVNHLFFVPVRVIDNARNEVGNKVRGASVE